jgi:hypothetical protein
VCELFETIATDQTTFTASRGIALSGSDVYWTSSASNDPSVDKYRVQRRVAGGSVETLLSDQPYSLGQLLFGAERLYVVDPQTHIAESIEPDGSTLRSDANRVLTSCRYRSGRIYFAYIGLESSFEFDVRSVSESDPTDKTYAYMLPLPGKLQVGDLAPTSNGFAGAVNHPTTDGDPGSSEIWDLTSPSAPVLPSGPGSIESLDSDAVDTFYWRRRLTSTSGDDLLMGNAHMTAATTIASGVDVTDLALFNPPSHKTLVYYAYSDSAHETSGIRLYDTSTGTSYDVVTGNQVGSLTTDSTYLYFFESNGHRLLRTRLPHIAFGLGN